MLSAPWHHRCGPRSGSWWTAILSSADLPGGRLQQVTGSSRQRNTEEIYLHITSVIFTFCLVPPFLPMDKNNSFPPSCLQASMEPSESYCSLWFFLYQGHGANTSFISAPTPATWGNAQRIACKFRQDLQINVTCLTIYIARTQLSPESLHAVGEKERPDASPTTLLMIILRIHIHTVSFKTFNWDAQIILPIRFQCAPEHISQVASSIWQRCPFWQLWYISLSVSRDINSLHIIFHSVD